MLTQDDGQESQKQQLGWHYLVPDIYSIKAVQIEQSMRDIHEAVESGVWALK